jgi:hypothetical protein
MTPGIPSRVILIGSLSNNYVLATDWQQTNPQFYVAKLLPILHTHRFVVVWLWTPLSQEAKFSLGKNLVFKTGAINHSTIPPSLIINKLRLSLSSRFALAREVVGSMLTLRRTGAHAKASLACR